MNKLALHHKMSLEYAYSIGNNEFVIKLKTAKDDSKEVILHYTDKFLKIFGVAEIETCPMYKVATDGWYDYYECVIRIEMIAMRYFFQVIGEDGQTVFYGESGFRETVYEDIKGMFDMPQKAREEERFDVPRWMKESIVYQIFPERFYRGKERETLQNSEGAGNFLTWDSEVAYDSVLGGSLAGIVEKLDYIASLGVNTLYLNPIFMSPSNHKYNTTDYYTIDPQFGTTQDFVALTKEVHKRGMRIVIDGVFNHCGDTFFAFQDVVKNGVNSRYKDWFHVEKFPLTTGSRHEKPSYETFGYYHKMPKLNLKNPEVQKYILDVVSYWTKLGELDAWRLDASDEISFDFWRIFRKTLKEINPEIGIIGEIWFDASEWLQGDQYDSVMNYRFRDAAIEWLAKEKMSATKFGELLSSIRGIYHREAYQGMWNLIDSHDTARFLTEANGNKAALKMAVTLQMTEAGAPVIYYGDEVGMTGGNDPGCRMGMIWDAALQDQELLAFYKKVIEIRKNYPACVYGDRNLLLCDDEKNLFVFEKSGRNMTPVLVLMNNSAEVQVVSIGQGEMNLLTDELFDGKIGPKSAVILKRSNY